MPPIFYRLPRTLIAIISGRNIWAYVLAALATLLIVFSGFDWYYYQHTRDPLLLNILFGAAPLGFLIPVMVPLYLWIKSIARRDKRSLIAAAAVIQAQLIALCVVLFLKAITGRVPPELTTVNMVDITHQFQFGFLRGGVFWGWPSSHTAAAFAMAATIWTLYPRRPWSYAAILYAFYIGIGVSATIHWFSEFVAGAIIASMIGMTVAKSFATMSRHRGS